jgi:purine catabolism regulator
MAPPAHPGRGSGRFVQQTDDMTVRVRDLLALPQLGLTLLPSGSALPAGALERPMVWVHSSDLPDPTPFLQPGHVLLTTGTWFSSDPAAADVGAYVTRLAERGIALLGFGADVVHRGTPDALVAACRDAALPLVEVPYRVPFIAIVQAAAELVASEANARQDWAMGAQRALSRAALQPDGLRATLRELARQLDAWVALIDAAGGMDRSYPPDGLHAAGVEDVRRRAMTMLSRGRRAGTSMATGGTQVHLQTLGAGGALRGVVAIGGRGRPDEAEQQVIGTVVALAGLALEQNHDLDRARSLLRAGLWRALLAGDVALVRPVVRELWGDLPHGPVQVALIAADSGPAASVSEFLDLQVRRGPDVLFHAPVPPGIALCLPAGDVGLATTLATRFRVPVGLSQTVPLGDIARGERQASQALARAQEASGGLVEFADIARQGMRALLARADAKDVALAILEPLTRHDERTGTALVAALRIWLEENGHLERSAARIGVHRHTLRSWLQTCERLLGRELDQLPARADLWAALLASEQEDRPSRVP